YFLYDPFATAFAPVVRHEEGAVAAVAALGRSDWVEIAVIHGDDELRDAINGFFETLDEEGEEGEEALPEVPKPDARTRSPDSGSGMGAKPPFASADLGQLQHAVNAHPDGPRPHPDARAGTGPPTRGRLPGRRAATSPSRSGLPRAVRSPARGAYLAAGLDALGRVFELAARPARGDPHRFP